MNKLTAMRAVLAALLLACLGLATSTSASAQSAAKITLLHGIPGVPVDVLVNGDVAIGDFQPGATQDLSQSAGQTLTQLEVRQVGSTDPVIGPVDYPLPDSGNVTLVAHLDAAGNPTLSKFDNNVNPTESGRGRLVVVHAAAAGPVDIVAGSERPITNLANGSTAELELPAGEISGLQLALTGEAPAIDIPTVKLAAGTDLIVYAVGSATGNTLAFYTQTVDVGETTPPSSSTTTSTTSTTTTTSTSTSTTSSTSTTVPVVVDTSTSDPTPTSTTVPSVESPMVTLLHGIPGVAVDVVVDGIVVFPNFQTGQFQNLSGFAGQTLKQLEVRLAGTTTTVIGPVDFDVPAEGNWTVLAHLDADGDPTISTFDNYRQASLSDTGWLTVVHAAAAPPVDVVVGDKRPIVNLANGGVQTLSLAVGTISGAKLALTGEAPAIDVPDVAIKEATSVVVYAIGSLDDGTLTFITQTFTTGLTVVDPTSSSTSTTIGVRPPGPVTGSSQVLWVFGGVLLASGLALAAIARRRFQVD